MLILRAIVTRKELFAYFLTDCSPKSLTACILLAVAENGNHAEKQRVLLKVWADWGVCHCEEDSFIMPRALFLVSTCVPRIVA